MREQRPYSRVYWSIRSDAKFAAIYHDNDLLATWLRLLIAADALWPEPADVPGAVRIKWYRRLVDAGLLDDLGHGHYRIHGLDAERERRSERARDASIARWTAGSTADGNAASTAASTAAGNAKTMLAKPKPSLSQAEPEPSTPPYPPKEDDPADAYWSLTGRYPTDKALGWLDDLAGRFGAEPVVRHLAQSYIDDPKTATLLGRVQDRLKSEARALDRAEAEDERRRLREKRAVPKELPAWEKEFRASLEARYAQ